MTSGSMDRPEVRRGARIATAFVALWTVALIALAALWVRSPFIGVPMAFAAWSLPAFGITLATWRWLRRLSLRQLRLGGSALLFLSCLWAATLLVTVTETAPRLALDGLIMRRDHVRLAGRLLVWLPLLFGGTLSVAALAASLEARYRIVNGPGSPSTRTAPGR